MQLQCRRTQFASEPLQHGDFGEDIPPSLHYSFRCKDGQTAQELNSGTTTPFAGECHRNAIVSFPVHAQQKNSPWAKDLDGILAFVRAHQTPARQLHIYGVLQSSLALAQLHGVSAEKAATVAALHDCAKHFPRDEVLQLQSEGHIQLSEEDLKFPALWHGPVGAWLARSQFGIEDADILDAVEHHTLGHADASPLLQLIMAADATEPTRCHPGVNQLRQDVRKDLRQGVLAVIRHKISDITSSGKQPHSRIYQTMKSLES